MVSRWLCRTCMKNRTISTALATAMIMATGKCKSPSGRYAAPDRRDQEDQERDEDRDVGPDGHDVLAHECTSIR